MFTISTEKLKALSVVQSDNSIALSDFLTADLPIEMPSTTLYNTTSESHVEKEPVVARLRALRRRMIEAGGTLVDIDELQRVDNAE